MEIIFLGKSKWLPDEVGGDAPCFLVDGKYLVDFGYKAAFKLVDFGICPSKIDYVFVTHCHHDHVLGMPLFLFYKSQKCKNTTHIYGLEGEIEDVAKCAKDMCMSERYFKDYEMTTVHGLLPGASFDVEDLHVECIASDHSVKGLCYRFTRNGKSLGILGDSRYKPEIAEFFKGCDAVVHEVSMGVGTPEHEPYGNGHSCAYDAARTASESGTGKLFLVHCSLAESAGCISAAKKSFDKDVIVPVLGERYEI